jgi:hypothetical protein
MLARMRIARLARSCFAVTLASSTLALLGAGCDAPRAPPVPLDIPEGCSPLAADVDCGLPYPSDFFLVDDATTPSGHRVEFSGGAKMKTIYGVSADITDFLPQDGFSRQPSIVAAFGTGIDPKSVSGYFADPARTLDDGFATAIVDADSGERIAHFIDVDVRAEDPTRQTVIVRPLQKLREKARYVVVLSGLLGTDGKAVKAPEGFRRLRDAAVGDDPVLAPVLARFETDVFPLVKKAGIDRGDVQLAWDFTTGSDEHVLADMLRARSLVFDELQRTPPVITVDAVFEGGSLAAIVNGHPENTWRLIRGHATAPRVVDVDNPGAVLFRDADGNVALNGTTTFSFTAIVPASVRDRYAAGLAAGFGHGFFGTQEEVEDFSTRQLAHESGAVIFGIDWLGMSTDDIATVSSTIGDQLWQGLKFGERLPQAMANWWTMTTAMQDGLFDDVTTAVAGGTVRPFRRPEIGAGVVVDPADATHDNAGQALVARDRVSFVGLSNGHILGSVMSSMDPRVSRVVLHVGGATFSHMMYRARPFAGFLLFLKGVLPDALDQQKIAAHMQREFDRFDPATYAPYLLHDELPVGASSNPAVRRVLQQFGLGDTSVPNLGSMQHARYIGLPEIEGSAGAAIFGLERAQAPVDGSGLFVFDLGVDASFAAVPDFPDATPVHDVLRRVPEVRAQEATFLKTGVIENPCDGDCGVLPLP